MASDFASQVSWSINSATQGNKRIQKMDDYDITSDGSVETTNEVGTDEAVGFIVKVGGKALSFTFREAKETTPWIDWDYLDRSKETFSLTRQVKGGQRKQWPRCMVSTTGTSGDKDGSHTRTVEIVALGEAPL